MSAYPTQNINQQQEIKNELNDIQNLREKLNKQIRNKIQSKSYISDTKLKQIKNFLGDYFKVLKKFDQNQKNTSHYQMINNIKQTKQKMQKFQGEWSEIINNRQDIAQIKNYDLYQEIKLIFKQDDCEDDLLKYSLSQDLITQVKNLVQYKFIPKKKLPEIADFLTNYLKDCVEIFQKSISTTPLTGWKIENLIEKHSKLWLKITNDIESYNEGYKKVVEYIPQFEKHVKKLEGVINKNLQLVKLNQADNKYYLCEALQTQVLNVAEKIKNLCQSDTRPFCLLTSYLIILFRKLSQKYPQLQFQKLDEIYNNILNKLTSKHRSQKIIPMDLPFNKLAANMIQEKELFEYNVLKNNKILTKQSEKRKKEIFENKIIEFTQDNTVDQIKLIIFQKIAEVYLQSKEKQKHFKDMCYQLIGNRGFKYQDGLKITDITNKRQIQRVIDKFIFQNPKTQAQKKQYRQKFKTSYQKNKCLKLNRQWPYVVKQQNKYLSQFAYNYIHDQLKNKSEYCFQVSDMIRCKKMFPNLYEIALCYKQDIKKVLKQLQQIQQKKRRKELVNLQEKSKWKKEVIHFETKKRLTSQDPAVCTSDVVIKFLIKDIITQIQLALDVHNDKDCNYSFGHKLYELNRTFITSKLATLQRVHTQLIQSYQAEFKEFLNYQIHKVVKQVDQIWKNRINIDNLMNHYHQTQNQRIKVQKFRDQLNVIRSTKMKSQEYQVYLKYLSQKKIIYNIIFRMQNNQVNVCLPQLIKYQREKSNVDDKQGLNNKQSTGQANIKNQNNQSQFNNKTDEISLKLKLKKFKGLFFKKQNDFQHAILQFSELIKQCQRYKLPLFNNKISKEIIFQICSIRLNLGECYSKNNSEIDKAKQQYLQALRFLIGNVTSFKKISNIETQLKQQQFKKFIEQINQQKQQLREELYYLGLILKKLGNIYFDKAQKQQKNINAQQIEKYHQLAKNRYQQSLKLLKLVNINLIQQSNALGNFLLVDLKLQKKKQYIDKKQKIRKANNIYTMIAKCGQLILKDKGKKSIQYSRYLNNFTTILYENQKQSMTQQKLHQLFQLLQDSLSIRNFNCSPFEFQINDQYLKIVNNLYDVALLIFKLTEQEQLSLKNYIKLVEQTKQSNSILNQPLLQQFQERNSLIKKKVQGNNGTRTDYKNLIGTIKKLKMDGMQITRNQSILSLDSTIIISQHYQSELKNLGYLVMLITITDYKTKKKQSFSGMVIHQSSKDYKYILLTCAHGVDKFGDLLKDKNNYKIQLLYQHNRKTKKDKPSSIQIDIEQLTISPSYKSNTNSFNKMKNDWTILIFSIHQNNNTVQFHNHIKQYFKQKINLLYLPSENPTNYKKMQQCYLWGYFNKQEYYCQHDDLYLAKGKFQIKKGVIQHFCNSTKQCSGAPIFLKSKISGKVYLMGRGVWGYKIHTYIIIRAERSVYFDYQPHRFWIILMVILILSLSLFIFSLHWYYLISCIMFT